MRLLVCVVLIHFFVCCVIAQQDTYRAAVVEYAPILSPIKITDRLQENIQEYLHLIGQAASKDVQIIVFPEDGLTGWDDINHKTVDELSTEVPNPDKRISPCTDQQDDYSKFFVDLSCAAKSHKIYAAVNLIERQYDHATSSKIYHNTNVVFDRNGVVIARFRKMNLFNEPIFVAGNETSTFETDFGVKFGMFICFDLMFKNSALDVLSDPAVTDIVYSAAWFSHLPFYGALSIQHGYAKSNGVNLLASGLNDPSKRNGGSGIYLADGRMAETYISGTRSTKLIIQDVPKISRRNPTDSCENFIGPKPENVEKGKDLLNIGEFLTSTDNTLNYTFTPLDFNKDQISENVCNGKFCCSFKISVRRNPIIHPNYVYKLIAYYGVSRLSHTRSLGLRNCVLVACLNETDSTCGGRHKEAPIGVTFESISVKATFNPSTTHFQPATLKYNLKPVADYTYCKTTVGDMMEIQMATNKKDDSLLVFGVHGRVYTHDDEPGGPIDSLD